MACTYEQLAATGTTVTQPLKAQQTLSRGTSLHACHVNRIVVALQGPNVPVWFSPEYLFDLISDDW
jgi:hypothetical protein